MRTTLDTTPKTMDLFSLGTACAMSVLATGMMNPMPIPVTARKKPSPHTFVIIYCMIKVSPTKTVAAVKSRGRETRAVTAPVEREQSALAPPARNIMMPTIVAIISDPPPSMSLM